MTPESKARFEAAKQQISAGEKPVGGSTQRPEQTSTTPKSSSATPVAGVSTESKSVDTSAAVPEALPRWQQALLKTGAPVFKPFAKFPEKQTRYEKYQEVTKQGKTCKYRGTYGSELILCRCSNECVLILLEWIRKFIYMDPLDNV